MVQVKICGINSIAAARFVNQVRPDYAGIVFANGRHHVDAQLARSIRQTIMSAIPIVGVFVDTPPAAIEQYFQSGTIQIAQLHGDYSEAVVSRLQSHHIPVIRVFKPALQPIEPTAADMTLLDSGNGSGQPLDWHNLPRVRHPFFLAGGLNPANVARAIAIVKPDGVDVSSGIELNGSKDCALMQSFVSAVHAIN